MDIATGPLSSLLPKLAKLLQDEYKLHKGARKGIEFLHKELETMHAVLRKVGEVPREQLDDLQKIWSRDVRELSFDMEDIVDTFMVEVESPDPPSKRGAKKIFNKMITKVKKAMARRDVAQDINDIKERTKELAERRDRYKVDDIIAPAKKIPVDPRLKALYTDATEIVGIEDAKEEVITMLREGDDDQKKRIVSIAGFGGLGKTTLAKAVYDEIKKDFVCTAFVSVSRNPDPKKLLKDMLYELNKEGHRVANLDDIKHLIDLLRESLRNKRYLIVIDDIWDKEPWDKAIGLSLIENNMRSRIITTTRNIDVAEHVGGCYRLKPLSDKSSEMLFYGRIFGSQDKCPRYFSKVSKKILKKCGGVPLAIVTTSSLLANKSENIKVWEDVCDSIGSGLGRNNPGMDDMRKILLLSYYDLPSHLKTCLLYLSIFPEDYVISKGRLIWRWIAEGFVQKGQQATGDQISFLEIGENYFNELLNRSLIQPADIYGMDCIPKACRLHDTVLDLIITLSVEECFITTGLGDGMESKVRWLSLYSSNTTWPTMKMPKLRSLTIFRPVVAIDLARSSLLRVLDLQGCRLEGLASLGCLGSLSHLRYLGVSTSTRLRDAPDQLLAEIGKLRFLQTLDISDTLVVEVPSIVIAGLGQLMCLRGPHMFRMKLPVGLKNLTSLEVLESVVVTSECNTEELGHLTKLRILHVEVKGRRGQALVESLGKLAKIESLYIDCFRCNMDGPLEKPLGNMFRLGINTAKYLPTWIEPASLPGLSYLDIAVVYERREDIQVLGTLQCLRHLKFKVYQIVAVERCVVGPDAFPRAVRCEFNIPTGVAPSMFPRGAMPMVEDLTFRMQKEQFWRSGCKRSVDLGLGHLPSLRRVDVLGVRCLWGVIERLEHEATVHPNHPSIYFPV